MPSLAKPDLHFYLKHKLRSISQCSGKYYTKSIVLLVASLKLKRGLWNCWTCSGRCSWDRYFFFDGQKHALLDLCLLLLTAVLASDSNHCCRLCSLSAGIHFQGILRRSRGDSAGGHRALETPDSPIARRLEPCFSCVHVYTCTEDSSRNEKIFV